MNLHVNGNVLSVDVEPDTPLLWVLREHLGLTGTKYGCGIGQCGACTVHIDGIAMRACVYPVSALREGQQIVTIEGLGAGGLHPVQEVWAELDVAQCGYCQPGMIMAASALLKQTPSPSDAQIASQIGNICRCGTYPRVLEAVRLTAQRMATRNR